MEPVTQISLEKYNVADVINKLFCTFTPKSELSNTLDTIKTQYSVLFNKIFVLEILQGEEYICTYNIDIHNSSSYILPNTILLHRKKETNTLYTINGLNALILQINNGTVDRNYKINWIDYKNTVILTQGLELRQLQTEIHRIVKV